MHAVAQDVDQSSLDLLFRRCGVQTPRARSHTVRARQNDDRTGGAFELASAGQHSELHARARHRHGAVRDACAQCFQREKRAWLRRIRCCLLAVTAEIEEADQLSDWRKEFSAIDYAGEGAAVEIEDSKSAVMMFDAERRLRERIAAIVERPFHIAQSCAAGTH